MVRDKIVELLDEEIKRYESMTWEVKDIVDEIVNGNAKKKDKKTYDRLRTFVSNLKRFVKKTDGDGIRNDIKMFVYELRNYYQYFSKQEVIKKLLELKKLYIAVGVSEFLTEESVNDFYVENINELVKELSGFSMTDIEEMKELVITTILGKRGSGKSFLQSVIINSLTRVGNKAIIFDYENVLHTNKYISGLYVKIIGNYTPEYAEKIIELFDKYNAIVIQTNQEYIKKILEEVVKRRKDIKIIAFEEVENIFPQKSGSKEEIQNKETIDFLNVVRNYGVRFLFGNGQRFQEINKEYLKQSNFLLGNGLEMDIRYIAEYYSKRFEIYNYVELQQHEFLNLRSKRILKIDVEKKVAIFKENELDSFISMAKTLTKIKNNPRDSLRLIGKLFGLITDYLKDKYDKDTYAVMKMLYENIVKQNYQLFIDALIKQAKQEIDAKEFKDAPEIVKSLITYDKLTINREILEIINSKPTFDYDVYKRLLNRFSIDYGTQLTFKLVILYHLLHSNQKPEDILLFAHFIESTHDTDIYDEVLKKIKKETPPEISNTNETVKKVFQTMGVYLKRNFDIAEWKKFLEHHIKKLDIDCNVASKLIEILEETEEPRKSEIITYTLTTDKLFSLINYTKEHLIEDKEIRKAIAKLRLLLRNHFSRYDSNSFSVTKRK